MSVKIGISRGGLRVILMTREIILTAHLAAIGGPVRPRRQWHGTCI
jgi:hypothetical protein